MSSLRTPTAPARLLPVLCAALLALAACARDAGDWKSAQTEDTQEAYEAFLARHPDSQFAPLAKVRAMQLLEEHDWAEATQADTPEAYQGFIVRHPDGKWTPEARIRIENFKLMAATTANAADAPGVPAAPATSTVAPPASAAVAPRPAATSPAPAPTRSAAPAVAPPAPRGAGAATASNAAAGHRVQLGAFSSTAKAEAEWARLRSRFPLLQPLEPQITAVETRNGRLFRLQAGVADAAEAGRLCERLKAGGQACLVVPPR
ncbi:MAG: SPOR domain-containing protein [Sinobacteraceae bacterium]|nr:SPOR domain-containing protein [Nevskiaceae bacterium]